MKTVKPRPRHKERDIKKVRTARDMFVQGVSNADGELEFPTVASLTGIAGVSKQTLYQISASEDWKGERIKVQASIRNKIDAEHTALAARESRKLSEISIIAAQGLLREVARQVNELDANGLDREGKPMKASTARDLSTTLKTALQAGKLAIGEPIETNGDFEYDETIRGFGRFIDQYALAKSALSRTIDHEMDGGSETGADSTD